MSAPEVDPFVEELMAAMIQPTEPPPPARVVEREDGWTEFHLTAPGGGDGGTLYVPPAPIPLEGWEGWRP